MREIKLYRADTGGFVLITPKKCLPVEKLETALSEVRSFFRQDNSKKTEQPAACPYCGSTDTIGHGLRETCKQVLTRRYCKSCKKTFVAGREEREAPSTKTQVGFLKLLGYPFKEIVKSVNRSESTVREHLEDIEIAEYRAQKQVETAQAHTIKPVAVQDAGAKATPDTSSILAPEFDRTQAIKECIGAFTVWSYNGSLAAKEKGKPEIVYLTKNIVLQMKALRRHSKQQLRNFALMFPEAQRETIINLIETLIDEDLGMYPMFRVETRVGDSGGIDAVAHEEGGYITTGGGE